ncbi:RipA family octameric membrane protein [Duganella callida]|uniref:Uncharacterized protein n=1 Tax=Duganella callida TaxID=2561932 RepID=A0A4Y9S849_9BURK|nr:hypothetical protein [Duganella callida]TFW15913.1 hypothetical protein E4L98_24760 [Duganella callida]
MATAPQTPTSAQAQSSTTPHSASQLIDGSDSPVGKLAAAFELALRQREFEIAQLTQRNNFFMIFQGVLMAGLIQSGGAAAPVVAFAVCAAGFLVSILQIGMAAGSKYWQVRWERAAKTTEIWLLEALKDEPRVSHFFTADKDGLKQSELTRLNVVNSTLARQADPLEIIAKATTKANREELALGKPWIWHRFWNSVILMKFSVSRIPIYVGAVLAAFWFFLLTFTISYDGGNLWQWLASLPGVSHLSLVPLKSS